jgi:hypothetical protein
LIQLSLFNKNNSNKSNYNIELSIEESIEKEGEIVLTNDDMDELLLMMLQNSLRAVRSGRHRQLSARYR